VNDGIGLIAPRVMACAAHEALTVVRLICGLEALQGNKDSENGKR
jgi:sulfur carrier protein ThiS adenylyltransferase